jgi:hypothetical protein
MRETIAVEERNRKMQLAEMKRAEDSEKAEIESLKISYQNSRQKGLVSCAGEKVCKKYFQLTQTYIANNSDMKLQIATDSVIETYNPTEIYKVGMKAVKFPGKGDSERIELVVFCKTEKPTSICMKKEIARYEGFKPYLETALR